MDEPDRFMVEADFGDIGSSGHLEIPIRGPGRANLLVFINGITLREFDREWDVRFPFDMYIQTDYKLRDGDVLINSSAYACLAAFAVDENVMEVALNETGVILRTSNIITLKVSGDILGDIDLLHVGYQVNLLVSRPG
jgi:hypothetical protein